MEPFVVKNKRKSERIPAYLLGLAAYGPTQIEVRTENISRDGLFLFSPVHIELRAIFELLLWLPFSRQPLRMFVATCFVEQTATGFGIGAFISGISTADRVQWEHFYERRLKRRQRLAQSDDSLLGAACKVLVLQQSIAPTAVQALQMRGMDVTMAETTEAALEALGRERFDLLVGDLCSPRMDGLVLCKQLREKYPRLRCVLMTAYGSPSNFTLGMEAGAARVIAKPCSHAVLVSQIAETYRDARSQECIPVLATGSGRESVPRLAPVMEVPHSRQNRLGDLFAAAMRRLRVSFAAKREVAASP
ncbi:MAG TPA: response regulator [Pseudomonadota bacterium]|jgi:DNA-binding response OmpR family regulator|nr:response regulator [Pseudomonadota bacterium]